jgi:hypothetical protein
MKTTLHIILAVFLLTSCDFIFKDHSDDNGVVLEQKPVILGNDKDDKGCVISAGYRWSAIRKGCIRVFEEGFRLNLVSDETAKTENDTIQNNDEDVLNAFVVFEQKGDRAELFLPNNSNSMILIREKEGKPYVNEDWTLETFKGFALRYKGELKYIAAPVKEKKFVGSDTAE